MRRGAGDEIELSFPTTRSVVRYGVIGGMAVVGVFLVLPGAGPLQLRGIVALTVMVAGWGALRILALPTRVELDAAGVAIWKPLCPVRRVSWQEISHIGFQEPVKAQFENDQEIPRCVRIVLHRPILGADPAPILLGTALSEEAVRWLQGSLYLFWGAAADVASDK